MNTFSDKIESKLQSMFLPPPTKDLESFSPHNVVFVGFYFSNVTQNVVHKYECMLTANQFGVI